MTTETATDLRPFDQGNELLDMLEAWLPDIDATLDEREFPISGRVGIATQIFLENFNITIDGEQQPTGAEIMFRPIFKPFYEVARRWYEQKYGPALDPRERRLEAVFLIGRTAFMIRIPEFINRVEVENESAWMIWPTSVKAQERPLSWVVDGPNFDAMTTDVRDACEANVRELAGLMRTASLNLMTATCPDATAKELAGQCVAHLESAARYLADYRQPGNGGLALWDVHQAIEKALKLYIRQRGTVPPRKHEVRELAMLARQQGGLQVDRAHLEMMPAAGEAIELRVGERPAGSLTEAMDVYRNGLRLFVQITTALHRRIQMHDAEFLMKKLPFID